MATVDSGTETLISDDSPCDLDSSPTLCSGHGSQNANCQEDVNSRLAPPNIQPYSGVLEKGKVVIRPIAFKPAILNPSSRFGVAGERYGSTPILTRPGSRLTLYGSNNDLGHVNYSLDRKLRSNCQSAASSPPLEMSSLTSLPHNLINYDSLESVRKSPNSDAASLLLNSVLDLTPSPSDSGVSELEAALRDRDSELAYLRQTMEHNEQVIFRVYQEKERSWEREIRRLKILHENTLKTNVQKTLKLEQLLMMQSYQYQQEKKRLNNECQRAITQNERLTQEVNLLRSKLEESEWSFCQKNGEISLLKSQLKDYQNEQTNKGHEFLQLRNDFREVRELLEYKETELDEMKSSLINKDKQLDNLRFQLEELRNASELRNYNETDRLRKEVEELREELSEVSMSEYEGMEPGRGRSRKRLNLPEEIGNELLELKLELEDREKNFEKERLIWSQEKEKVLRYQRQLQMNYVQMYRKTRSLEAKVESLSIELELEKTGIKKPISDFSQIEL